MSDGLSTLFLNCALTPSPAESDTEALARVQPIPAPPSEQLP